MTLNEALSIRLNELLNENKMTAYRLFMRSGVSQSTISSIRHKKNEAVNLRILFELCEGFGIGLADFFDSPLFSKDTIVD